MNIVVLAGGTSTEREVSLSSGGMIRDALRRAGHRAVLVDVFFGLEALPEPLDAAFDGQGEETAGIRADAPDIEAVRAQRPHSEMGDIGPHVLELCRAADVVFMGLHGENGENGRLQALFDVVGIRYTGCGYLASALAMNKWIAKQLFAQNGIPSPRAVTLRPGEDFGKAGEVGLPCVVKPCSGGSSIGVAIARDAAQRDAALREAFRLEDEVLVEAYVQGREFSVGILGGEVLPPIEIVPKEGFYDYSHKYQAGWTEEICPAPLPREQTEAMQRYALAVYRLLGMEVYARVDFLMDGAGNLFCLEANTLPGMTPVSLLPQEARAVGISFEVLCQRIIELSLGKRG